jgi:hypothetical protein
MTGKNSERFIDSATRVGAEVKRLENLQEAIAYITKKPRAPLSFLKRF